MSDQSWWDELTPKSKGNAFDILANFLPRINTRAMQFHADARVRTAKVVERILASGVEPAKLNISKKRK
jgi:hypothetical protein